VRRILEKFERPPLGIELSIAQRQTRYTRTSLNVSKTYISSVRTSVQCARDGRGVPVPSSSARSEFRSDYPSFSTAQQLSPHP
jgi:hypothetical protein